MKIFLVIPTLKQGGAERVMSELANSFANSDNLQVHLVLLAKANDFYTLHENIIVHRLQFCGYNTIAKLISEFRTLIKLRKLIKKEKPVAILSFMEKYNILSIVAAMGLNIPVIVSDRSNPLKKIPKTISFLRKHTYRYAAGIIAQTKMAERIISKRTKNKNVTVIHNPARRITNNTFFSKEKIILNVGRLVPEKGQQYLIDMMMLCDNPDWQLVIAGDGPLKTELLKMINKKGLANRITLLGGVANVDEWLHKSSIFVFSSISEGFPNALVEAMAAGLPVVSFDCNAGPRDLINNGLNGFLVPEGDVERLANTVKMLMKDESLRTDIGGEAKKISAKLNVELIARQYLNFMHKSKVSYENRN